MGNFGHPGTGLGLTSNMQEQSWYRHKKAEHSMTLSLTKIEIIELF